MSNNITKTLEGLGRQVQYFPGFARCFGDVKAAIFLGQLLYWWPKRTGDSIYKTAEEWEEETGLSEKEQRRAREVLKRFQILTEEYRRLEHRMHYFLNEQMLDKVWNEFSRTDKKDVPELTIGQFGKEPNGSSSINTKLQQEITTIDSSAPTALAPKKLTPMKDDYAQAWQDALTARQPDSTWSNYGKERKALVTLGQRTRQLMEQTPYQNAGELIESVIRTFSDIRQTAKDGYWKNAPMTPSAVLTRWAEIWAKLSTRTAHQDDPHMQAVWAEILSDMEGNL